ncbi:type I restriction-modification system, S subunit [Bacteroidia bacterium]|nr:type I restriction-modification system, S subunit [Bacteroidia bacterium]
MIDNKTIIPEGWKSNKLGIICRIQKGVQFNKIELSEYGLYPCINGGIEPSGYSDLWNTKEDTITISEGGNSCGYINFQKTKFWSGGHCYTLLDAQKDLEYEFLFWALKGKQNAIMELRVGSGLPNIQQKTIKEFTFISPISIIEQRQIASILSKLDEAIAQTEQLIEKYKQIKTGLMHDLLTRGIDGQGNIRSEETHKFKNSPLGRIPVEWEIVKLGDLINAVDPQPDHRTPPEIENGVPYLGISDFITHKVFDFKKCRKVSNDVLLKQQNSFNIENGDLIFGKIGTIGKPTILPDFIITNFALSANVILIKPNECPNFIYWSMETNYVLEQVKIATHSTSQPAFGIQKIRDINIICPTPKERYIIVDKLDKIESVLNDTKIKVSKLRLQKSGLMHDLLSGKIRVNNCDEKKEIVPNATLIPLKMPVHNQHIEDAVLIAAIVNLFYSDKYPLGRKKVQKLLYLIRRHQEANVDCFKKKAAGPYADEIRYKGGEPIAIANKYIVTKSSKFDKGIATLFSKGEKIANALEYIEKWNMQSDIDWLFAQFKWTKVDELELIATVDMARCDLEKEGIAVSLSTIKNLIATNKEWKAKLKKSYFDDLSIQRGINESYKLFGNINNTL